MRSCGDLPFSPPEHQAPPRIPVKLLEGREQTIRHQTSAIEALNRELKDTLLARARFFWEETWDLGAFKAEDLPDPGAARALVRTWGLVLGVQGPMSLCCSHAGSLSRIVDDIKSCLTSCT